MVAREKPSVTATTAPASHNAPAPAGGASSAIMPTVSSGKAAIDGRFDIVALSFSSAYPLRQAVEGLNQLRRQLPSSVALWAGGAGLSGKPPRLDGVRIVRSLDDAVGALREWRAAAHGGMH